MIAIGPLGFLAPWLLAGLAVLPLIWWLLRFIPPKPQRVVFPPTRLLKGLKNDEHTPKSSPWWLTALRLLLAALIIVALARPVLNPDREALSGKGPVVIVVDNGWASGSHWREREDLIGSIIARAERQNRSVVIAPSAGGEAAAVQVMSTDQARDYAATLKPMPFDPDRRQLAGLLEKAMAGQDDAAVFWLTDGLDYGGSQPLVAALQRLGKKSGHINLVRPEAEASALGLYSTISDDGVLTAHVMRAEGNPREGRIQALSSRGEKLTEVAFALKTGALDGTAPIDIPLEIRNQIARLEIEEERSAGAVHLLDARSQWRRVGIISGEAREAAQPLLSPLYYVEKALTPYAETISSQDRNLVTAMRSMLQRNVSVLILADIGKLVGGTLDDLEKWVDQGGTLIRFAGPRLEQGGDSLLPQPLRHGGRTLGGSLSWSTPQPLAPFDEGSPFNGLQPSHDILVKRQVLTDPSKNADSAIWVRLKDGTPLVSAARHGKGRLVLFHVTANSEWSNLPMSGLFVEMLRRVVERSTPASVSSSEGSDASTGETSAEDGLLSPQQILNGFGELTAAISNAPPLKASEMEGAVAGPQHPPGYYGPVGATRALNLLNAKSTLIPLGDVGDTVQTMDYEARQAVELKAWLLAAALFLFLLDAAAVLALSARLTPFHSFSRTTAAALGLGLVLAAGLAPNPARAADASDKDGFALQAALKTRLAYVITGDDEIDRVSKAGLTGLSKVLAARTAVEPSEPMGVDVHRDELAFFPLLYWPVSAQSEALPDATLAKIDAYMKQGGTIVFDTRDYYLSPSTTGQAGQGPGAMALARLIGKLDIPPLAPVPEAHVLTKSFYLMRGFPGRWDGGVLWAEAQSDNPGEGAARARRSDGVSSILITSNDFAAAWALDDRNQPLFPAVPGGEMQREMAFRSGVNIVMYALTGNYKADQVHVPALLERLGQ